MYPDLSYLFHDLFGTPYDNWTSIFKTFGILLVSAILGASFFLYLELKRKKENGTFKGEKVKTKLGEGPTTTELLLQGLLGFILGFKILHAFLNFAEFKKDAAEFIFSGQGNFLGGLVGAALFAGIRYYEKQKARLDKPKIITKTLYPHDRIGEITVMAALSGVVGAKVFAIIENLPAFFADPVGQFFSGNGLAIYGGLIGGFLGVGWYLRRHQIPMIHVMDAVAPALMVGYGIGRMGCHFSGDGDWGIVAGEQPDWWFLPDWLWAYDYPNNVAKDGVPIEGCEARYCSRLDPPVYPTPVYETTMAFLIAGFLRFLSIRISAPGLLFFIYLTLNGIERFFIEKIRVNIKYDITPSLQMTQAEIIAIVFMVLGLIGCYITYRQAKKA
ncbi:MAG: prolipoprotein diacylglyceryl transferase family protein [Bacteroidota bacterium]